MAIMARDKKKNTMVIMRIQEETAFISIPEIAAIMMKMDIYTFEVNSMTELDVIQIALSKVVRSKLLYWKGKRLLSVLLYLSNRQIIESSHKHSH